MSDELKRIFDSVGLELDSYDGVVYDVSYHLTTLFFNQSISDLERLSKLIQHSIDWTISYN